MAARKDTRKTTTNRPYGRMMGERGGARYRIKPVSVVGGGQGGILSPSGVGQVNI